MNGYTIILPLFGQPNFLATTLWGLVRNSRLKNRIIVIWSDPARQNESKAKDYLSDHDALIKTGKLHAYQKYSSVQDYMTRKAEFIAENNIEFVDITEPAYEFMQEYKAGKIWKGNAVKPAPGQWEGGQDIAFKDNWGISLSTSEWTMVNWDADFWPTPGWDEKLMELAVQTPPHSIIVPTQMQPLEFDELPNWPNIWEDSRVIACARLTMPINKRGGNTITNDELEEFFYKNTRDIYEREIPGRRARIHHFPVLYRTEELKNVLGPEHINYQGAGYDLAWDDDAGRKGFMKYTTCNSWCCHKAYIAVKPEWV